MSILRTILEKCKRALGLADTCEYCGAKYEVRGYDQVSICPNRCEWKQTK